jgi:uncharacterized protein YjbI with pentapeptide repeats
LALCSCKEPREGRSSDERNLTFSRCSQMPLKETEERMSLKQKPRWRPTGVYVHWTTVIIAVFVTLGILGYLIYLGYGLEWTGLGQAREPKDVRAAKTLWDWLALFIVPVMLAGGGFLLNRWQKERDEAIQQAQKEREEIAANQRAQDEALRAYLDQMSNLIVDQKMREAPKDSDTHRLAQARTIAILLGLDQDRKKRPLKLLYELSLIVKEDPIIKLKNAGLDTADLSEITLHDACLREADLRCADLRGADLKGTELTRADLRGANLSDANLSDASLAGANLLPYDENNPSKLNASNLSNGTDPRQIDLSDGQLVRTKMDGAYLSGADLSGAYLTGVEGVTNEQLERQAYSLKGATMPDGQKYEDWFKSKGSGEEGENSGHS